MGYLIFALLAGGAFGWLVFKIREEERKESERPPRQRPW